MNKAIENKIKELHSTLIEMPNNVLEVFNHYYGEDRVDMQNIPTLEEFKEYMTTRLLSTIIVNSTSGITTEEYDTYIRNKKLEELDGQILKKVLSKLTLRSTIDRIGNNLFNNINILVHFPSVKITNEHDRFTYANHMYAKLTISYKGALVGNFSLNRAEYSYEHMVCGYMHSHVSSIPRHDFTQFQNPCLGSGPIRGTQSRLNMEYDEDLWGLFCLELDRYIHTESLSGGPYHRLENLSRIGRNSFREVYLHLNIVNNLRNAVFLDAQNIRMIQEFLEFFLKSGKMKFAFNNGGYAVGMSPFEANIVVSNAFIEWYNALYDLNQYHYSLQELIENCILKRVKIQGTKIRELSSNSSANLSGYNGSRVCTFKGEEVRVVIKDIEPNAEESNLSIILNPVIVDYIITKTLNFVNYNYGKTTNQSNRINKKIKYL